MVTVLYFLGGVSNIQLEPLVDYNLHAKKRSLWALIAMFFSMYGC